MTGKLSNSSVGLYTSFSPRNVLEYVGLMRSLGSLMEEVKCQSLRKDQKIDSFDLTFAHFALISFSNKA